MLRAGTALAAALLTFAITSGASAAGYCVAPATGCEHPVGSLQDALAQAAAAPGDDTISLGAATYAQDGLAYAPGDGARVSITGVPGTVIAPATATTTGVTLSATGPLDLTGLALLAGSGAGSGALSQAAGGNLDHVRVQAEPGATSASGITAVSP